MSKTPSAEILLLSMPFGSIQWPSLALSNLKAVLNDKGTGCDVRYFTFEFARWIGVQNYLDMSEKSSAYLDLLGDWIFSGALFGCDPARKKAYQDDIIGSVDQNKYFTVSELRQMAEHAADWYDQAPDFIEHCYQQVEWQQYKLVGFTSVYLQNTASLALAKLIKARHPEITIAFGGSNFEGMMGLELLRQFEFIDFYNHSEGELSFPAAIERIMQNENYDDIPGIVSRSILAPTGSSDLVSGEISVPDNWVQLVEDMDSLPYPDPADFFNGLKQSQIELDDDLVMMSFESSRGCWWGVKSHCSFCGLNHESMAFRSKSPERALAEIKHLHEKFQCRRWQVVDDIIDLKYFKTFFPKLRALNLGADLIYETKSCLKKDQVKILADAGMSYIQPGIEQLSSDVLKLMRKGVSGLQNIQLLKWSKQFGVRPIWNMLWGFPGEKPQWYFDMEQFIPLLYHLAPPRFMASIRLDRFSPLFDNAAENGIFNIRVAPPYHYVYPFPENVLNNISYAFLHDIDNGMPIEEYTRGVTMLIKEWERAYEESALLLMQHQGQWHVIDTRPMAVEMVFALNDNQFKLLKFCDRYRGRAVIEDYLSNEVGMAKDDVTELIDDFKQRGFLIEMDQQCLALPVESDTLSSAAMSKLQTSFAKTSDPVTSELHPTS